MTPVSGSDPDDRELFWDLAAELFCVLTPEGKILRVNPAWTRVLGWGEDELVGHSAFEFVHPDDLAATRHVSETENAEGQRLEEFQNRYRHKDGSYRWLSWTGHRRGDRWFGTARDVTATRMSHSALQRSERRSRALLAALQEGLMVTDARGRIIEVNEPFTAMVGIPASEVVGLTPPYPWWPPEGRAAIAAALRDAMSSDRATFELTFMRADGARFPVLIDTSDMLDVDGRHATVSVIRDVSELVTARDRLAEAHRVAGLVSWEFLAAEDEVVAFGSPRAASPHEPARMTGAEGLAFIREPSKSTLLRFRDEILRGERDTFTVEIPIEGPETPGWVEVRGEALRAPDGQIVGVRGTSQRIDARKRAELEARLQRDILDALDVAVLARGPDQTLVFANEAAVRLLGWAREELEGTRPDDVRLIAPDQPQIEGFIDALKRGAPWEGELVLQRRDGSRVRTRVRTAAVRDETGATQYVAGIVVILGDADAPA